MYIFFLSIFMFLNLFGADKPISCVPTLIQLSTARIEKLIKEESPELLKSIQVNALYYDSNLFSSEFLRQALIKKGPVLDGILVQMGNPEASTIGCCNAYTADIQSPAGYVVSQGNTIGWGSARTMHSSTTVPGITAITALATEDDGTLYFGTDQGTVTRYTQDAKYDQIYQIVPNYFPTPIQSIEILNDTMLIQSRNAQYEVLKKIAGTWSQNTSLPTTIAQLVKKNKPRTQLSAIVNVFSKLPLTANQRQYYNLTAFPFSKEGRRILLSGCIGDPIICPDGTNALYPTETGINECAVNRQFAGECAPVYTDPDPINAGVYGVLSCHPTLSLAAISCTKENVSEISILNLKTGNNFSLGKTIPYSDVNALFTSDGQNLLLAIQPSQDVRNKVIYNVEIPILKIFKKTPLAEILKTLSSTRYN